MTKTILLALLAMALATDASAQSRTFYDSSGKRIGSAAGHGVGHDRQRASRPHRPEPARSALVAVRRADEGQERVHHAALGLGA